MFLKHIKSTFFRKIESEYKIFLVNFYLMLLTFNLPLLVHALNSPIIKKSDDPAEQLIIQYLNPSQYEFFLEPGRYKVVCYGAQGGMANSGQPGGKGAVVSGYFDVRQHKQKFFAFVGGQGIKSPYGSVAGGFNGGGISGYCNRYKHHMHHRQKNFGPGSGGGATDLRIDTNEVDNRIIVAAGGSGAGHETPGAPGGDINGYNAYGPSPNTNQVKGNSNGVGFDGGRARRYPSSGGGGGYRGGISGVSTNSYTPAVVSDSGSSYISGYTGCVSHSKMLFKSGSMKSGVHEGNGKIEIWKIFGCSDNCIECVDNSQCRNCDPSFLLYEGSCYSTCPVGTIDRSSYCEKCDSSCKSCSEVSTNCTSCHENYFHYKDKCLSKCPAGTFEFGDECYEKCPYGTYSKESKCDECQLPCIDCTGKATKCTDCIEGKYLFNNECVDKCPDRTVRDGNKCLTECQSDQFLYSGFCYSQCPKGTYAKGVICENCDSSCAECRSDASTCISCNENTYLHNSKCLGKCPEGFYSYNNKCVANCPSDSYLNGIECVDICPKGKYGVNHACKNCDSICETCENSSSLCTKCSKDKFLYNNSCLNECPEGTFIYKNECVEQCPSGSNPSDNICQEGLEYYDQIEMYKREPRVSKTVAGVVIAVLVVVCIVTISLIVYLFIRSKNNGFKIF